MSSPRPSWQADDALVLGASSPFGRITLVEAELPAPRPVEWSSAVGRIIDIAVVPLGTGLPPREVVEHSLDFFETSADRHRKDCQVLDLSIQPAAKLRNFRIQSGCFTLCNHMNCQVASTFPKSNC